MMNLMLKTIFDLLSNDIVSHGLVLQSVEEFNRNGQQPQLQLDDVLKALLQSGRVEIGSAKKTSPDYVEFIAWKGTVEERLTRSTRCVNASNPQDREFAYWLCLRENVDRFEE
jgi:hypothetical protein